VDVLEVPASEVQRNASFALPLNGAGAQAPQQVAAAAAAGAPPLLDLGTPEGSALVEAAGAVWLTQLMKRLWPFIARAAEEAVTHVLLPKTLAEGVVASLHHLRSFGLGNSCQHKGSPILGLVAQALMLSMRRLRLATTWVVLHGQH
jgi:hypothetical protein